MGMHEDIQNFRIIASLFSVVFRFLPLLSFFVLQESINVLFKSYLNLFILFNFIIIIYLFIQNTCTRVDRSPVQI